MEEIEKSRFLPGDPTEHHVVPYKFNIGIWVGLVVLTIMTVLVSTMGLRLVALTVVTALVIALTKAIVVANYFMHLKYDNKLLKILFSIVLLIFMVFIVLTAIDYITR